MRKIIDGKRYDTETAKEIGTHSSHGGRGDLTWFEEGLYKTRSGAYFLAGEGNAKSHYAESLGNSSFGPGERLTVLTRKEALAWAENHLRGDEIEAEFADMISDA